MTKHNIRQITGFLTAYSQASKLLYSMKLSDFAICMGCVHEDKIIKHIVYDWPTLLSVRLFMFDEYWLKPPANMKEATLFIVFN